MNITLACTKLGTRPSASEEEIKKAFRQKAKETHPDNNPHDTAAAEKFREITEAYQFLLDSRPHWIAVDLDTHSTPRKPKFHRASPPDKRSRSGELLTVPLKITFEEAMLGTSREIHVFLKRACVYCQGNGSPRYAPLDICTECSGTGVMDRWETLFVPIPPGTRSHQFISLPDGHQGERNGPRGELMVLITVEPHPCLRCENYDIVYDLYLTFTEMVLGSLKVIPTLTKPITVQIQMGTTVGQKLHLPGRGIKRPEHRGDQILVCKMIYPENLPPERREELNWLVASTAVWSKGKDKETVKRELPHFAKKCGFDLLD